MRSVPTTSLDLSSPDLVADPYPFFDAERAEHPVAWHEGLGLLPGLRPCQRQRGAARPPAGPDLGGQAARRLPGAVQPAAPQPDDGERAAGAHPAAPAGGRRVRPRAHRTTAAAGARAGGIVARRGRPGPASTSSPRTPNRCRSWSSPSCSGCPPRTCRTCGTGRRRSCGCTSRRRRTPSSKAAVAAAEDFAGLVRELADARGRSPADGPDHRPGRHRAHRRRGRGRGGAAAQRRPRGVGERVRQRPGGDAAPRAATGGRRRADRGGDAPLRLRAAAIRADRDRAGRGRWRRPSSPGRRSRCCSARPTATRRSSTHRQSSGSTARPTTTSPSASGCTSAWVRHWPGWSWSSRVSHLFDGLPLAGPGRRAHLARHLRAARLPSRTGDPEVS